ncbi:MAG: hypothetical protein N2746_09195 [Deltaproteobacteria bacterium]|nr:hypothetical protein [Deltaproteobacteria bacterium]
MVFFFTSAKSLLKVISMGSRALVIFLFIVSLLITSCSSEPCEDLKEKAESCNDSAIRALLLKVAKNGDKQECTDYLNSYYYTFGSRCVAKEADVVLMPDIETN